MSLTHIAEDLYRRQMPILIDATSWEEYIIGTRDTVDIKIGKNWLYDFQPPYESYKNYIFTMSPLEKDLKRYREKTGNKTNQR